MGKITPGVTPEDEFRRVINEAGGNVQINTTPANLLKALKDIGGTVSYDSGDTAIVPAVNEGGGIPPYDPTIDRNDLIPEYESVYFLPAFGDGESVATISMKNSMVDTSNDKWVKVGVYYYCKGRDLSLTINGIKIPKEDVLFRQGLSTRFMVNKSDTVKEAIALNNNSIWGSHFILNIGADIFSTRLTNNINEPYKPNNPLTLDFIYGDAISVESEYPRDISFKFICPIIDIPNVSGTVRYGISYQMANTTAFPQVKSIIESYKKNVNYRPDVAVLSKNGWIIMRDCHIQTAENTGHNYEYVIQCTHCLGANSEPYWCELSFEQVVPVCDEDNNVTELVPYPEGSTRDSFSIGFKYYKMN